MRPLGSATETEDFERSQPGGRDAYRGFAIEVIRWAMNVLCTLVVNVRSLHHNSGKRSCAVVNRSGARWAEHQARNEREPW
jgi:hypothetical protein